MNKFQSHIIHQQIVALRVLTFALVLKRLLLVMTLGLLGVDGLLLGQVAYAKGNQADSCANAKTQLEMNQCYGQQVDKADTELNAVYRELMSAVDKGQRAKLKTSESAWIKFRDANCAFVASRYKGGSVYPTIMSSCIARVTKNRTAELRQILEEIYNQEGEPPTKK